MKSQQTLKHIFESPTMDDQAMEESADALLNQIREIARQRLDNAAGSHDWQHTLRVHSLCRRIGPLENADMQVLEAAAFLHDIGRSTQDRANGSICHAVQGARLAEEILAQMPLDAVSKNNIIHCVRTHRFRGDQPPVTVEAKVLFDADKLDAIGAVGIARAYLFAGELGACLHNPDMPPEQAATYSRNDTGHREFAVKLSKVKDRIITHQGRLLAKERHAFMETFFERFLDEYQGRC